VIPRPGNPSSSLRSNRKHLTEITPAGIAKIIELNNQGGWGTSRYQRSIKEPLDKPSYDGLTAPINIEEASRIMDVSEKSVERVEPPCDEVAEKWSCHLVTPPLKQVYERLPGS
jgi:hypothetical protein